MILCCVFGWKETQKQWWLYPWYHPGQQFFLVRNLNKEVRQWNAWRVWLGVTGGGWNWTPRDPVRNKCMDYTDNNLEGKAYVWLITEILMSVLSFFVWGEGWFCCYWISKRKRAGFLSPPWSPHLFKSRRLLLHVVLKRNRRVEAVLPRWERVWKTWGDWGDMTW